MQEIEKRIDRLLTSLSTWQKLEAWAERHGNRICLDEYRDEEGTYDDSVPESLDFPAYACLEDDTRQACIAINDNALLVIATNHGPCGNNYMAAVWDVDVEELPLPSEED